MVKSLKSLALLAGFSTLLFCLQSFTPYEKDKWSFQSGKDFCTVELCAGNILKVDYRPNGLYSPGTPVVDENKRWEKVKSTVAESGDQLIISTSAMKVKISKSTFHVSLYNPEGELLLSSLKFDPRGGIAFSHDTADNFYGVYTYGSHSNDGTLLRNKTSTIQAFPQGGSGAPFIWTTSGYGIVVNTNGGQISNSNGELSFTGCSRTNTEFYLLAGTPKEIIAGAGNIAGLPPMFPKWNTGFGQLEWGIDEAELKTHIDTYRKQKIPFDWFMLDFDWMAWGEDSLGELRWGKKFPGGANGDLGVWAQKNGLKIIGITKPRVIMKNTDSTFTQQGKYVSEHHFEYPELETGIDYFVHRPCMTLDFRIPECREWWAWNLINGAYKTGMSGFLNDEADLRNPGKAGLGNLNNHYVQQAIYEEQRKVSNERVYSINRTAYMGSQKYSYALWSGDNFPTFSDLKAQCLKLIAANNALIPVWGFCASAFGNKPKLSNELYIRSLQLAAFSPLFFLHGTLEEQKQPWFFGDKVVSLSRDIVNLRYRLIPYAYSYDRVKHESMLGIARSLAVEFPKDPEAKDITGEFMYGDYLLVAPVLDSAVVSHNIYLPEGTWIDFAKGTVYTGNQHIAYATQRDNWKDIPLFIRKGAILPTQDIQQYVGENETKMIYLDLFPDQRQTSFPLYDDDGTTYNYEKGDYFKQVIAMKGSRDFVRIEFGKPEKSRNPSFTRYLAKVHGEPATEVLVDNAPIRKFASYGELQQAVTDGYCITTGLYGKTTCIKLKVRGEGLTVLVKK